MKKCHRGPLDHRNSGGHGRKRPTKEQHAEYARLSRDRSRLLAAIEAQQKTSL